LGAQERSGPPHPEHKKNARSDQRALQNADDSGMLLRVELGQPSGPPLQLRAFCPDQSHSKSWANTRKSAEIEKFGPGAFQEKNIA